ncbi:SH3 domain-containing protein [Streptomyces sp. NPDC048518]|uniref:SH3 domain-containing protein n=1 Tax=Streptomyces sp. NPDC048518 TaxID=3155029 RepID=UPI0033D548B6
MMLRKAVTGCATIALTSAVLTGSAQAAAEPPPAPAPAPAAAPRATVTPSTIQRGDMVTVKVAGAPKECRAVQAKSPAFEQTTALSKSGNPPAYSGHAKAKTQVAPGVQQVTVAGIGCGKWVAKAQLTVLAAPPKTVKGVVTAKAGIHVRQRPTTASRTTGTYRKNQAIALLCKKAGQPVGGNRTWYQVKTPQGWVAARYVKAYGNVPNCK